MPYNNRIRKKKSYIKRKRGAKSKQFFRKRKGLRQQIVPFTRIQQMQGDLRTFSTAWGFTLTNEPTPIPAGGPSPGLVKTLVFQMDTLPGISVDIPSLFKMYRLNAVKITFVPASNNTLNITTATPINDTAIMVRCKPNRTGTLLTAADRVTDWNQTQAVKRYVLPMDRESSIYMKLNQLTYTYRGNPLIPPGNFSYGVCRPKWLETSDLGCDHYGLDMRFDTVAGQDISDIYANVTGMTILTKYYFQCKGVK